MPGVISLKSRQRRMMDWMSTDLAYRFIAIGRTSPWPDESNPPVPDEKMTEITELIRFAESRFIQICKGNT